MRTAIRTSTSSDTFTLDKHSRAALFTHARSAIAFDSRAVTAKTIARAWEMAKFGPTSNNTQPLRLMAARSIPARVDVIEAALPLNRAKLEQAPLLLVVARDSRFHDLHETWAEGFPAIFDRYEANPEMRESIAHSNTMLQLGYLIIALRSVGLAVRPYGGFDKAMMDSSVMPEHWRSEVILGVGYPAVGNDGAGERRGRVPADVAIQSS